ncbi:MAG: MFS transporter [Promethearchaeota archaeon]
MEQKQTFKVIVLVVFFSSTLISILSPMAIDIANALPMTQAQVLQIVSIYLAIGSLFSIIWAFLDNKFPRKTLLLIATVDWTIFTFLTTFASNFVSMLIFQIFSAIGFGAILPLSYSTIVDLIEEEERGKAFGIKELFYVLGIGMSFLLASLLVPDLPWQTPLYIITIGGFVCVVLLVLAQFPEKKKLSQEESWISLEALKEIVRSRAILLIIAFNFFLFFWYGAITQYYTTLLRNDYGFEPEIAFVFYLIAQIGQIPSGPIFGSLGDRVYKQSKNGRIKIVILLVTCGSILNFLGFSLILSVGNVPLIVLFVILTCAAAILYGGVDPNTQATLGDITTDLNRPTTYAINNLCYIFGRSISIFLLSIFIVAFNNLYRPGYMILSIASIMSVVFLLPLLKILPKTISEKNNV